MQLKWNLGDWNRAGEGLRSGNASAGNPASGNPASGNPASGNPASGNSGEGAAAIWNFSAWRPGDWAVYRKSKQSSIPGPRATRVTANPKGETYNYVVDKYWIVEAILPEGQLLLRTASGKSHTIDPEDRNLRHPSMLQRFLCRDRFRRVEQIMKNSPHAVARSAVEPRS